MTPVRIDLLQIGKGAIGDQLQWQMGESLACPATASGVALAMQKLLSGDSAFVLFWDTSLGWPANDKIASLARERSDVLHAGLRLGMAGMPKLLDFVAPNWMLNRDPDPTIVATSWRLSLRAALVRTSVLRALGGIRSDYDGLDAASLELGHRYAMGGALLRHVPSLVPDLRYPSIQMSLADELRFIGQHYGDIWVSWAAMRSVLTGHATTIGLIRSGLDMAMGRKATNPPAYVRPTPSVVPPVTTSKVTILIPTVDRYPYLRVLLGQLRTQSVRPLEIIVVDQTEPQLRDLALRDDFADLPLHIIYQAEAGQCRSRNAGLLAARGDFVLFLDDDDEVATDLVERHLVNLIRHEAEVSCGVALEPNMDHPPQEPFVRISSVFPTNNTMIRWSVLIRSGLFDLAYDRAQRADGDLGMRVYLSGALMVLDPRISVLHHHAPSGGLRKHRARIITYGSSRKSIKQRHLPSVSDIYLTRRYFTANQVRELMWIKALGTLSAHGHAGLRLAKLALGLVLLPGTIRAIRKRYKEASTWLLRFPQIPELEQRQD